MLKNIIIFIICLIIIIYIFKYNTKKESFTQYYNPYSISSNNLTKGMGENYQYNNQESCFDMTNIFNIPLNISIAFKNSNLNNYPNSEKRKLFCKMNTTNVDSEFRHLLNNSLPYNNPEIYTGENSSGNEWEIIPLNKDLPSAPPGSIPPKLNKCGYLIRNINLNRYLSYGHLLKELDYIQDNKILPEENIQEENLHKNIVYTGPHKYINKACKYK